MNSLVIFSAICVGLVSAGGHHTYYSGANTGSYSYGVGPTTQQRQLVDVPYTVEVRSVGSGLGGNVARSWSYQQPRQQVQIQRAQLVQQQTYSHPQQLVTVPYSVQTVQRPSNIGYYSTAGLQNVQVLGANQLGGVAHAGTPIVVTSGGGYSQLSGAAGHVLGGAVSSPYIISH